MKVVVLVSFLSIPHFYAGVSALENLISLFPYRWSTFA